MSRIVDFENVSMVGLESSPVAEALAGLRANEARYFMNKYKHEFTVVAASDSQDTLDYVNKILKEERGIEFAAKPLETSRFQVEGIRFAYVFYEDGLGVNVMYTIDDPKKRAVGFKLSDGMEVPEELEGQVQVRQAEVQAGRHDPRLVLRDQGRVLEEFPPLASGGGHSFYWEDAARVAADLVTFVGSLDAS